MSSEDKLFEKLRKPGIEAMMNTIMEKFPYNFLNTGSSWIFFKDKEEFCRSYGWTYRELIDECMDLQQPCKAYTYGIRCF